MNLTVMNCPKCKGKLVKNPEGKSLGTKANKYKDCHVLCNKCNIGMTNATNPKDRTFIRKNWRDGLWNPGTADRLEKICRNRLHGSGGERKIELLAFERSEDLMTWNVFEHLERLNRLEAVAEFVTGSPSIPGTKPILLYWGYNTQSEDHNRLRETTKGILSNRFEEEEGKMSEPDIMLMTDREIILIEAKYGSSNNAKPTRSDSPDEYVSAAGDAFAPVARQKAKEYYQLVRNWALAFVLSNEMRRDFWVVNLVRNSEETSIEKDFRPLLAKPERFVRRTWEELVKAVSPDLIPRMAESTLYFQPAFDGFSNSGRSKK